MQSHNQHLLTPLSLVPVEKGRQGRIQAFGLRGSSRAVPSAGWNLTVSGEARHWDILSVDKASHLNGTFH